MTDHSQRHSLSLGPQLPYSLGRFTLCRELGAGGMATVYLSKMRLAAGLERLVAVKTIHGHLAKQQTFVDMFLDEAKIASHISHPNVCAVYDFGDVGGVYYIAMEYLVGEPLIDFVNAVVEQQNEDLLEHVPFLAARIIADAAEGLHAAHTLRGSDGKMLRVIHRDVSPQNLFVTYEGSVKVVDFGCAKALERVTQTNTGIMKGKVSYAAPEQLQGQELDARVDVFALGVCLWECLTLTNLFRRDNAILTAKAVLEDHVPRADEGCPWVPRELADIAEKALQRDRNLRFENAREMGRALRGFIAGSGRTFEAAEVADWMEELFRDRHDQTLQQLAEVEDLAVSKVSPVSVGDAAEPGIADAPTRLAKTPSQGAAQNVWELSIPPEEDPVVLPTRTGRYVALVLAFLALVGAGAYAYFEHRAEVFAILGIEDLETPASAHEPGDDPLGNSGPGTATPDTDTPDTDTPDTDTSDTDTSDTDTSDTDTSDDGTVPDTAPADSDPPAAEHSGRGTRRASGSDSEGSSRRRRSREREDSERDTRAAVTPTDPPREEHEIVRPTKTLDFSRGPVVIRASGGWAIVEFNGRRLGRTPVRTELPVGRQRLRVLPGGQEPAREITLDVAWGEVQTVTVPIPEGTEGWENPYGE